MWKPTSNEIRKTHLYRLMQEVGFDAYEAFYQWSVTKRGDFWARMIADLGIRFAKPYSTILRGDAENPSWCDGAELNIAESCFQSAPDTTAILFQSSGGPLRKMSYGELDSLSNRVANGLVAFGFKTGEAVAIDMPMTAEAVAIYLGIVKAGMVVVSIADSFAPAEIATRLRIAKAKGIFTQDVIVRGDKTFPLYEKVIEAGAPRTIVIPLTDGNPKLNLRKKDSWFSDFLSDQTEFHPAPCRPNDTTNVLFSSGTTGDPKAIPWTHLTPIKSATDGYLHHDIHPGDVVCWPTNLGWMMGPWLIYATLINKGTMGLYCGAPTGRGFGEFVRDAKVTMLGVVPSIVKEWRASDCMKGIDFSAIQCFSSTGECSNADDYDWLMRLPGAPRPIVEYCGGTEIGGGYMTQALLQEAIPSTFSTPTCGLEIEIIDGEVYLIPPSIGLSQTLLNRDHHEVYYKDTPKGKNGCLLRRHGDELEKLDNGYYRALGRADDTMNLGGIKVSSAEIERVLNTIDGVQETAAVAVAPEGGGPSQLVVFCVIANLEEKNLSASDVKKLWQTLQTKIKTDLNPLFKIHDLKILDSLPRTASNKVMRRVLRDHYSA